LSENSEHLVEHLFRTEYSKLIAILTRIFGTAHLQLAEDIMQETLISALSNWGANGIPENPSGWLVQVAKRKVLNELNRNKMMKTHHSDYLVNSNTTEELSAIFLDAEIEDSQLRMIFMCCHPSLTIEAQISLTLKTMCGFGVKEVANALLTSESTINKRLYRAKATIRESNLLFEIPQGAVLESRLETVCLTLYLLFNEGYNSSIKGAIIQKDLCLEAIRLTKLLVNHFIENKQMCALLSLMCFHTARFDARIDDNGSIVLFEDQNRALWNKELIGIGMQYLQKSSNDSKLSTYHIEANIAAEHCIAESFKATNWEQIHYLYTLLEKFKPNPIIQLNLAIIQSKLTGEKDSLVLLDGLADNNELKNYYLLPATQGIFNLKLGNLEKAIAFLERAKKLAPSATVSEFIVAKIEECKGLLKS